MNSYKLHGVTIHDHMDAKTLIKQWEKIPAEFRINCPLLGELIDALKAAEEATKSAWELTIAAKKALKIQKKTLDLATAGTFNVGYIASEAAAVVKDAAQEIVDEALVVVIEQIKEKLKLC